MNTRIPNISEQELGPSVDYVVSSGRAPKSAAVVIVGGGIIGVSTALFLAQQGVSVVLCEKGHIAGEQSSRNWGWVRRMGRDPRELPLIVEAMALWDRMKDLVGEDVGFRRSGILYLAHNERDAAGHEAWLKSAGAFALDTRMISGRELESVLPGAARPMYSALYTASDGRAEPQMAAPAIARAAQRAGAVILTDCAVLAVETSAGAISGVATEQGVISCNSVVIAGGAWSSLLCGSLGLRLPQLSTRSSVLRTAPLSAGPEGAAWGSNFAFRKRLDGGYTIANGSASQHDIVPDSFRYFSEFMPMFRLEWRHMRLRLGAPFIEAARNRSTLEHNGRSPFQRQRTLSPRPVATHLAEAQSALVEAYPVFANASVVQRWAGMIDAMPDAVPVISPVQTVPGLIIATGFSGHGFGIGPAAGRLAADLVTGGKPIVDPRAFRYDRFTDGSPIRPMGAV